MSKNLCRYAAETDRYGGYDECMIAGGVCKIYKPEVDYGNIPDAPRCNVEIMAEDRDQMQRNEQFEKNAREQMLEAFKDLRIAGYSRNEIFSWLN